MSGEENDVSAELGSSLGLVPSPHSHSYVDADEDQYSFLAFMKPLVRIRQ